MSPVSAEEYPICPDTIVYHGVPHELDDGVEARAAKRRRIESYAVSYLRGEPLFILTAQLRGPFTRDWQNPWSTPGKAIVNGNPTRPEIPETSKIVRQRHSLPHAPLRDAQSDEEVVHSHDQKVERWLKTNKAYGQLNTVHSQSSPTPHTGPIKPRTKKWESPMIDMEFPPVPDEVVSLAQMLPPLPADLPALNQVIDVPEDDPRFIQVADVQLEQDPVHPLHTIAGLVTDVEKAEFAMLASKRRSLHTIPASSHLPAFEYRRVTAKEQENGETPGDLVKTLSEPVVEDPTALANTVDAHLAQAQADVKSYEERQDPPLVNIQQSLSKVSSCNETEDQLPSAQVIAQPPHQSAISNLSSHGETLLELHISNAPEGSEGVLAGDSRAAEPARAPADTGMGDGAPTLTIGEPQHSVIDSASALQMKNIDMTPKADFAKQLNTQQMVNSITPFAMSTIKKKSYDAGTKRSPAKATKARTSRNKKRASFALEEGSSGSSHGAIRMTMKVAKPAISLNMNEKTLEDKVSQAISQEDGIDTSFPSTRVIKDKNGQETSLRGILKASMSGSLNEVKSSKQTTSSSAKQDAQKVSHFNVMEDEMELNDDTFDVAAAIDDLGSFLGTWDAEMDAAGVRKT